MDKEIINQLKEELKQSQKKNNNLRATLKAHLKTRLRLLVCVRFYERMLNDNGNLTEEQINKTNQYIGKIS